MCVTDWADPHPTVGNRLKPVHNPAPRTKPGADDLWTTITVHDCSNLSTAGITRLSTPPDRVIRDSAAVLHNVHSCYYCYARQRDGVFAIDHWGFARPDFEHLSPGTERQRAGRRSRPHRSSGARDPATKVMLRPNRSRCCRDRRCAPMHGRRPSYSVGHFEVCSEQASLSKDG